MEILCLGGKLLCPGGLGLNFKAKQQLTKKENYVQGRSFAILEVLASNSLNKWKGFVYHIGFWKS